MLHPFLLILFAAAVDFQKDAAPILEQNCASCHNRQALVKNIVPGKPASSPLYLLAALPQGSPNAMPPMGPKLAPEKLDVLKHWIEEGAVWPEGVTLKAPSNSRTRAEARWANEHREVEQLHDRLLAHAREAANNKMGAYKVTIPNTTVAYDMVPLAAGDFRMGSPDSDPQYQKDEQPQHKVHVDAFWMQAHEVTWDEYRLFMFANQAGDIAHKDELVDGVTRPTRPYVEMSFGMGIDGFPAISMTQHAANKYAEWLSAKTGEFYRLPTEAEWEYACRAGSAAPPDNLGDYAWYSANAQGKYQKVESKKPNAFGLYDMLGNVAEWTLDQYEPYQAADAVNPWVKAKSPYPQVARGGSWNDPASACRCAARLASDSSWKQQDPQLPKSVWYLTDAQWLGFRLVRPSKIPDAAQMYAYWNNGVEHDEQ